MKYTVQFSREKDDIGKAQAFRGLLFRGGAHDCDVLDDVAIHGLIHARNGELVSVFRMIPFETAEALDQSYSAQFYDLADIKKIGGRALELGRFCIHPEYTDPDIVRLAWAELTKFVLDHDIDLLFGCSSFHGSDVDVHSEALALLKERHLAPNGLMPLIKAPKVFEFAKKFKFRKPDLQLAQKAMPPLLRSYLLMGGWVSDHAVVDHDLNTVHVFTGVEVKKIPPARRRLFAGLLARS